MLNIAQPIHTLGVPLAFVLLGIFANLAGRRDGASDPLRNSFAVGTSTFLMSLGTVISDATRKNTALFDYIPWIVMFFVMVLVSLNLDRYVSWEADNDGVKTETKRLLVGIWMPNIVAVIAFFVYSISTNGVTP